LIRQAARSLGGEPGDADALAIEAAPDLPEVLVDREQVAEALSRLLGNASHRAGGLKRVRVRLAQAEAMGERGVRPEPFVRVDVLFPREEITEEDLGAEEGCGASRIGARTWPTRSSFSRPTAAGSCRLDPSPTSGACRR
jgi:hypothetical protein